MSKFLYFQDMHIGGKNPISRKGNFFEDILIKVDELLLRAKEHEVDMILDGGDIFHSPEPSYRILDELADKVEKIRIPIYSLFGNHCQLYKNIENSQYTGLAHLQKRSKLFQYMKDIIGKDFIIGGVDYAHNIEQKIKNEGIHFSDKDKWKIAIVHAFITPKPFRDDVMHVVCDDIKTNADLILVSHYHAVWEKKIGNTHYLDIGCSGRRSISEHEVKPSFVLIDTNDRSYNVIALNSAKLGTQVFDLSKKEQEVQFGNQIDSFIEDLKDLSVQSLDIKGIIEDLGKKNNVDREIVDILIHKVNELEKDNVR